MKEGEDKMTTVLNCIERIPERLQDIKDHHILRMAELKDYIKNKKIKEVIFVASGSSYNAAFTAHRFFHKLNIPTRYFYPNIFVNYQTSFDKDVLYVMISQGGNTKLVYEATILLKEKGCMTCSICESTDSMISKSSDVALDMGSIHEEFMYRTIGYSTTVATCWMVALTIAKSLGSISEQDINYYLNDFQAMIDHLDDVKNTSLDWYEKHRFTLMHKQHMMFSGTNDLWAVACEADIKVMEMVPMITRSFELEEFIHGPQNAFDSTTAFFIFSRVGEDDQKVHNIASFIKNEIGFCSIIGGNKGDERDLMITSCSENFASLEYITTMQVIAYKLADDHGRDLSRPVNGVSKNYIVKTI